jgi:hypothetical protein
VSTLSGNSVSVHPASCSRHHHFITHLPQQGAGPTAVASRSRLQSCKTLHNPLRSTYVSPASRAAASPRLRAALPAPRKESRCTDAPSDLGPTTTNRARGRDQ